MRILPPIDRDTRRVTRRSLLVVAVLFAFNAAIAAHDGRLLLAALLAAFVLCVVGLRTYTTLERWPAAERWLRSLMSGEGH